VFTTLAEPFDLGLQIVAFMGNIVPAIRQCLVLGSQLLICA
jgi:hypothetical protein